MPDKPKFKVGDVVIDRYNYVGIVRSITQYPAMRGNKKVTRYQVNYSIAGKWNRSSYEEDLSLYTQE